ncbi:putative odorant receptor 85e [Chrysoperla carnea]|uniref:putative odorant receptor 85e n=1 Tax=Chrysoperla carnea TaxID=189513 RepID=UPI001D06B816|nr:putative odorant receptor 85e [Chrysoperla carnea]
MKLMAMWPISTSKSNPKLSLTCTLDLILNSNGELIKITEGLINSLLYIVGTIQIIYFQIRAKDLLKLVKQLNQTFRYESAHSLETITMQSSYEYAKKLTIHWSWICVVSALGWMLNPFLMDSPDGKRLIPLKSWYPFDYQTSPNYELVYGLQGIGQIILGSAFGNLDCMFMTMVILTSGQYNLLRSSLKNIRYTAMLKAGITEKNVQKFANYFNQYGIREPIDKSKNLSIFAQRHWNVYTLDDELLEDSLSYTNKFDKELEEALNDCVKHHQAILEFCELMEWFFSPIVLIKMVYGTVFLCLLAYSATSAVSVSIRNSIYECPWYVCNKRFKTSMQLILMRCNKPVILTGGKFFRLSVQTYISKNMKEVILEKTIPQ